MSAVEVIDAYVRALPGETRRLGHVEWGITVQPEAAGGWPLDVGLRVSEGLLRAQAFALPAQPRLDFGQFLHWNRQTRIVRFACTHDGDIWVHGELPVKAVDAEQLDRLLGLVAEAAVIARDYGATLR